MADFQGSFIDGCSYEGMGNHTGLCVLWGTRREQESLVFGLPNHFYNLVYSNSLTTRNSSISGLVYTVASLRSRRHNNLDVIFLKMVFHTTVYVTWKERNSRRHQCACLTTDTMLRRIDKAIRNRICSLKYTGSHKLEGLLCRWFEVYSR